MAAEGNHLELQRFTVIKELELQQTVEAVLEAGIQVKTLQHDTFLETKEIEEFTTNEYILKVLKRDFQNSDAFMGKETSIRPMQRTYYDIQLKIEIDLVSFRTREIKCGTWLSDVINI